jgi:ComF family protein
MSILDILFPPSCLGCQKSGSYLCPSCLDKINFNPTQRCPKCSHPSISGITHPKCHTPHSPDGLHAIAANHSTLNKAIKRFKYSYVKDLAYTLAHLLTTHFPTHLKDSHYLLPIPLHPQRLRQRGFNQAQSLAQHLSKYTQIPLARNLLIRTKPTPPQADINQKDKRIKNIQGAFSFHPQANRDKVKSKTFLLVDDISTTGATICQATLPLKRAGADQVWGLVLAR